MNSMTASEKGAVALSDARAFNKVMLRYGVNAVVPINSPEALRDNCKVYPSACCIYKVNVFGSSSFGDVTRYEKEVRSEIATGRKALKLYDKNLAVRFDSEPFLTLEVDPPTGYFLPYDASPLPVYSAAIGKFFRVDGEESTVFSLLRHHQSLVAAVSGHGKSRLLRNMLIGLVRNSTPAQLALHIIDMKNDDLTMFKGLPHTKNFAWKADEAAELINTIRTEVDKRIAIDKYEVKQRHLLVIDEGAELDKACDDTLASIMKLGRSLGIHVVMATQHPTSAQIGPKVAQAFTHRFIGRVSSASSAAWATGCGGSGAELLKKQGSFLYVFGGDIDRFQTFNLTAEEEDMLLAGIAKKKTVRKK